MGGEQLRLASEYATDFAIVTLDTRRTITSWSRGAEAIFGYEAAEMLGEPFDVIFTPEDIQSGVPDAEVRKARDEGRAEDDRWHLRKDGSRFFASGVLSPLGKGGTLGFVKVLRDLTMRKRMEDELRSDRDEMGLRVEDRTAELGLANKALRAEIVARTELLRRLVTAQEDEGRRIARDLHDGLGQELTALLLTLKAIERSIPEGDPGLDFLREAKETVTRIGREAHDLAIDLRPTSLDELGLRAALQTYIDRWSRRTKIDAEFQSLGLEGERLPPDVETMAYRVMQEALNNVAKHSGASQVDVIVNQYNGNLAVLIEDNGKGFEADEVGRGRMHLGLMGMRERASLVGGEIRIDSAEGRGTMVRLLIPLEWRPADPGQP